MLPMEIGRHAITKLRTLDVHINDSKPSFLSDIYLSENELSKVCQTVQDG